MNFLKSALGALTGGLIGGGVGSLLGGLVGGGGLGGVAGIAAGLAAAVGSQQPQLPKAPVTPDAMLADLRKRRSAMLMGNIAPIPTLLGGAQPQGPAKNTLLGE